MVGLSNAPSAVPSKSTPALVKPAARAIQDDNRHEKIRLLQFSRYL